MATTNQKPTIDTQKLESKEHKHATKEKNHQGRNKKKRIRKNYETTQKTSNKMEISMKVILIILNVHGLNPPIKRYRGVD